MKTKSKNIFLIILLAGIVSMTIVYATLSTVLNISTTAKIAASKWDIHFENLQLVTNENGNTGVVVTPAQIQQNTTQISGLVVDLKKPGDSITYTFDIVNDGDIDSQINSIVLATPTCTGNSSECDKLDFSVKYTTSGQTPSIGNVLNKKTSINATLTVKYKDNNALTDNDISVRGLGVTFIYGQK